MRVSKENNDSMLQQPVLILAGPTAIGKTQLSLDLATGLGCEIISVDSMQVYRHMDIGTAKVTPQERELVPHHLIDIVTPDQQYDAGRFVTDCVSAIKKIHNRGKLPLLTGGTGLYYKALVYGLAPELPRDDAIRAELQARLAQDGVEKLHEELSTHDSISAKRVHKRDKQRVLRGLEVYRLTGVPWSTHIENHRRHISQPRIVNSLQIGLTCQREILYKRINTRCQMMFDSGLEQEVRKLMAMGYTSDLPSMSAIGYRHMVNYITGVWQRTEMMELLARDTRRYAKRQYTWFSSMNDLVWMEITDTDSIYKKIEAWLSTR